jgi:serine/threonine-protein kinase
VSDLLGESKANDAAAANDGAAAANAAADANAAAPTNTLAAANVAPAAPAPRASQVEPLRDLPAAQAAASAPPTQVASIKPPPPVSAPPRPHVPTIAIIAAGDVNISEPAEQAIEQALSKHGYHLVDQDMMPRVDHLLRGPRPNVPEILKAIASHGNIDAIVVVHARNVGSQQMNFYGQSDTLVTAQLNINAFAVEGRRKLAAWSDNVNFTAMSARDKAEEAVEPMLAEIEDKLSEFRPRGRKE